MCSDVTFCPTVRRLIAGSSQGTLAQSTAWMFTFDVDVWNRLVDEPESLQSYTVLEIKSVSLKKKKKKEFPITLSLSGVI